MSEGLGVVSEGDGVHSAVVQKAEEDKNKGGEI